MKKNVVIVEIKTNEEADAAILEIDEVERKNAATLDAGKVRPSASGLVRHASGLVRDASGLVRDDEITKVYKDMAEKVTSSPNTAKNYYMLEMENERLATTASIFLRFY